MAGKAKRLSKVAREFNVGISTIVDFLSNKGHDVESSPNAKIDPEVYEIIAQEYESDANLKKKSEKASLKKEKRETVSIKDKDPEDDAEDIEDVKEEDAPAAEEPTPAPAEVEEVVPVNEVVEKAIEEPNFEAEVVKEEEPEPAKETPFVQEKKKTPEVESDDSGDIKVIGKIDLDKINPKTRPSKKSREQKVAEKEASIKIAKEQAQVAKKEKAEKAEKAAAEAKKVIPEKVKIETIKAQTQKLTGPTVVGKIVLPVEKPKTSNDPKKKRKRIKKVGPGGDNKPSTFKKGPGQVKGGYQGNKPGQGKGRRNTPKVAPTEAEIQKEIKDTLARLSGRGKSKSVKNRREKRQNVAQRIEDEAIAAELDKSVLKLTEFVTVSEIATMMNVSSTQVISSCMSLGIFASINQRLDAETLAIIAEEFGFTPEFVSAEVEESIVIEKDKEEDLTDRPPIVTVMGHVDHGKTSLLDHIRSANVIAGEAGGITQHIGAYSVQLESGKSVTFLDTPGHEAFTAMRARGAQVTDVAIIIVAADDDVMTQTKEAISHAQAAGVPMVFAINKIDKPGANPDKVKEQLSQMNILVEDWGGKFQCQEISAKNGTNIDELIEKVLLEAELLELKANPNKNAVGTIIEAELDKGRGFVNTVLVEAGTLKIGDVILAGRFYGKVKAMHNERGQVIQSAGPATPVQLLGIQGAPSSGDKFNIMNDEKEAKAIASKREQLHREQGLRTQKHITLDEIGRRLAIGNFQELNVIVKGDVDGSIEALADSLLKLSTEQIQVNIIHKGVGQITETDVNLAAASDAIIVGFQVRPSPIARRLAETEEIDIRLYSIIYQAIDEIKAAMEGMLSPEIKEEIIGTAEIRETFKISKVGTIAGCYVTSGLIKRSSNVRVIRDGVVVYTGLLGSLKRFKDDVKEVKNNYECGLNIDKYNNIEVGDIVEAYEEVEVARKL
jgi:translation initiation factor IF-2